MSGNPHESAERPLLTRQAFRAAVLERDVGRCVLCGTPGVDAHHLIERRLFTGDGETGGYFLDNGVTVCADCHLKCEATDVSVEEVRRAAGITKCVLPQHLYSDQVYDKWGNIVLPNNTRLKGELFYDESVQKIIAGHLGEFTHYVKFPRTWHLPWSPGMHDDDRMLPSIAAFEGQRVVVTKKMDGENTTMYNDYIHARSLDGRHHPSRDWVKQFWSTIAHNIPEGWRVCGENLFAQHSISYADLPTYFLGFHVWNDCNVCLAWDETLEWFELVGIKPVEVLFDGIYNDKTIRSIRGDSKHDEGYVMRIADAFSYGEYRQKVGKFVRANHIRTVKHHWQAQPVVRNTLAGKSLLENSI